MLVYVVEQGAYSDRRVVAIYTDKAKAEALAAALYESDVEEFETDVIVPPEHGHKLYTVDSEPFALDIAPTSYYSKGRRSSGTDESPVEQFYSGELRVDVWARDEEHALKIAADKFREHVARVGWKRDRTPPATPRYRIEPDPRVTEELDKLTKAQDAKTKKP